MRYSIGFTCIPNGLRKPLVQDWWGFFLFFSVNTSYVQISHCCSIYPPYQLFSRLAIAFSVFPLYLTTYRETKVDWIDKQFHSALAQMKNVDSHRIATGKCWTQSGKMMQNTDKMHCTGSDAIFFSLYFWKYKLIFETQDIAFLVLTSINVTDVD